MDVKMYRNKKKPISYLSLIKIFANLFRKFDS